MELRSLNEQEIENIIDKLQPFVEGVIQSAVSTEHALEIEIYTGQKSYLFFDMQAKRPFLLISAEPIIKRNQKKKKPLQLFINSNFIGYKLTKVSRNQGLGRVIDFEWSKGEQIATLSFVCIPHAFNLSAEIGEKSIHWRKPKDLEKRRGDYKPEQVRSYEDLANEWWSEQKREKKKAQKDPNKEAAAKKKKLIKKLNAELDDRGTSPWKDVIAELSQKNNLNIDKGLKKLLNLEKSLSWNLQNAFTMQSKWQKKTEQLKQRVIELEQELEKILSGEIDLAKKPKIKALKPVGVKAKSFQITDQQMVLVGRTAAENLKLLRQAKPWDLWLHLKDYPGSYGIIRRHKKEQVSDAALTDAAQWVAKMSFGQKSKNKVGEKLQVLVAECRYVRPIKGDKLGRVNYQNERVMSLIYKGL